MPPMKTSKQGSAQPLIRQAMTKATPMPMKESKRSKGKGLIFLGRWIAERHDQYNKRMERIQKMIPGIILAEKRRGRMMKVFRKLS